MHTGTGAHTETDAQTGKPHTVLPKDEARQAVTGHNVRYVLGFGLVAVVIAFAVIYAIYFA
jgi:hypothetical protein